MTVRTHFTLKIQHILSAFAKQIFLIFINCCRQLFFLCVYRPLSLSNNKMICAPSAAENTYKYNYFHLIKSRIALRVCDLCASSQKPTPAALPYCCSSFSLLEDLKSPNQDQAFPKEGHQNIWLSGSRMSGWFSDMNDENLNFDRFFKKMTKKLGPAWFELIDSWVFSLTLQHCFSKPIILPLQTHESYSYKREAKEISEMNVEHMIEWRLSQ